MSWQHLTDEERQHHPRRLRVDQRRLRFLLPERDFFIDNLLVRIHFDDLADLFKNLPGCVLRVEGV